MAGHSDLLCGCVSTADKEIYDQLFEYRIMFTAPLNATDCALLLRSLRTLHLRMARHCESAMEIAHFLTEQPAVLRVNYPGLESHPQHEIAKRIMKVCELFLLWSLGH